MAREFGMTDTRDCVGGCPDYQTPLRFCSRLLNFVQANPWWGWRGGRTIRESESGETYLIQSSY